MGGGGGADFQIFFEIFVDLFFQVEQIGFASFPKAFWPKFLRRRQNFEKKTAQKSPTAFLGFFWKILTKKSRFFWRALPTQN